MVLFIGLSHVTLMVGEYVGGFHMLVLAGICVSATANAVVKRVLFQTREGNLRLP